MLNAICKGANLYKTGRKPVKVERISRSLCYYLNHGEKEKFNRLADLINGFHAEVNIKRMDDPILVEAFERASKAKEFVVDQEHLISPYRIVKAVSGPVYFPAVPDGLTEYELPFSTNGINRMNERERIVGLLFKIYDHESLPDNPARGRHVRISLGPESVTPSSLNYIMDLTPDYVMPPLDKPYGHSPVSKMQSVHIMDINRTAPYYFQVFQVELDLRMSFNRKGRSADRVHQEYLRAASAKRGMMQPKTMRLSLQCPLSRVRMKLPIRWPDCQHLQCIDWSSWNHFKRSNKIEYFFGAVWLQCPICQREVADKAGFVDEFMKAILDGTGDDVDEVCVEVGEKGLKWSPAVKAAKQLPRKKAKPTPPASTGILRP